MTRTASWLGRAVRTGIATPSSRRRVDGVEVDATIRTPRRKILISTRVCFDTGGLDIKPAAAMLTMKKDMGGAAHVLGLAAMVMDAQLPVRLRVLVPAVENAIPGAGPGRRT